VLALLHSVIATQDAATEGKKVITWMLIVGLVFVGVIAIGQTLHWLRHRR
jgi:ABC-type arginine transport system permease subunit